MPAFVLWSCVPSFCPLYCFVFGVLSLNMALFRVFRAFLAGFGRFVWVYVVLVLCVACVAFVRVWSQADQRLEACLPLFLSFCLSSFAPMFASFYARCPSLLWLSFFVLLHCLCGSLGVVVVSFSLPDYTQKERAQRFCSLRPLFVCCGFVWLFRFL